MSNEDKIIFNSVSEKDSFLSGENFNDFSAREGKLAVDVGQAENELIIVAPMAGASPQKIELHLHNDLLTIRGEREVSLLDGAEMFYEENYWGPFSRTIVLPVEVRFELAEAIYKNGVLTIRLPKKNANGEIPIVVVDE